MAKYYPINLNLKDKKCVVTGGGRVALRKVKTLVTAGAKVTLVSPEIVTGLKKLRQNKKIIIKKKRLQMKDLKGAFLIISATDDSKLNKSVSSYCRKNNILVNVVDAPKECSFILPSVVSQGDLTIAISTAGISPALSKKIKQDLEKVFDVRYACFLKKMKKLRPEIIKKIADPKSKKAFFNKMVREIR